MKTLALRAIVGVCLFAAALTAATSHNRTTMRERIICVVPMVGSGTLNDPHRPMFASSSRVVTEAAARGKKRGGIESVDALSFHSVPTDDGQHAIVEFSSGNRTTLKQILAADPNAVVVFEPNKISQQKLEKELRKFKKNFDVQAFLGGAL